MAALLVLREKVIKPVLSTVGRPRPAHRPKQRAHYERLQDEMRELFQDLGIAA